jgi:quercetin dioxygenase-like cupin family protein
VHISEIGTHPRRSPGINGPSAEPLITNDASELLGVIHLEIPAGVTMPEHDHGASQIVLIPLSGAIELRQGEHISPLSNGMVAHIGVGERVGLANTGDTQASVVLVATPPQFVHRVATWPEAAATSTQ